MADAAEAPPASMTPEDYLAHERSTLERRSEYWDGKVLAMGGASWAHNVITANFVTLLNNGLRGTCRAVGSDLKVHVPRKQGFVYPDVVVVCEPRFLDGHRDVIENPVLIAEVLSPSTERFDRGDKFDGYRSIPSVKQVLLLSQSSRQVERYERLDDDSWRLTVHEGDAVLDLTPLMMGVLLESLYAGTGLR